MTDLPADLRAALSRETGRLNPDRMGRITAQLIERYQADRPAVPGRPIMASDDEARAYAAYRMPATYAAIRAVLDQLPDGVPGSHLDLAGGTGAAVWAVADRWESVRQHVVWEQAPAAIKLGRALAASADQPAVRAADWREALLGTDRVLPSADLVTIGYLLSEIDETLQHKVIEHAAEATGQLLIIVEPGTKKGYRRILAARDQLLDAGMSLVAPCPHDLRCPLQEQDQDWCHFFARINRSAEHRRAKGAELGYEDEKFSYLVAAPAPIAGADGRILRHPRMPKGRVELQLCQRAGGAARVTIGKRDPDLYRAARKAEWGDPWPPR